MFALLFPDWRVIMLRAVAALAFGVLTLVWPGVTLWALVVLFGTYVLVDGVFELVDVVRNVPEVRAHRAWLAFDGLIGIAAGVITLVWPAITALALLYLIAFWALFTGAARLWFAIANRRVLYPWASVLGAALSIAFGILLLITPGSGALVITWLIGWYAIVFAVVLFALGWQARATQRQREHDGSRTIRPVTA
jgi:uncharacterized membrane protein HdeD (DUF308 family)